MTKKDFVNWLESNHYVYVGETTRNETQYDRGIWSVFITPNGDVNIGTSAFSRTFHGNVAKHAPLIDFLS